MSCCEWHLSKFSRQTGFLMASFHDPTCSWHCSWAFCVHYPSDQTYSPRLWNYGCGPWEYSMSSEGTGHEYSKEYSIPKETALSVLAESSRLHVLHSLGCVRVEGWLPFGRRKYPHNDGNTSIWELRYDLPDSCVNQKSMGISTKLFDIEMLNMCAVQYAVYLRVCILYAHCKARCQSFNIVQRHIHAHHS